MLGKSTVIKCQTIDILSVEPRCELPLTHFLEEEAEAGSGDPLSHGTCHIFMVHTGDVYGILIGHFSGIPGKKKKQYHGMG